MARGPLLALSRTGPLLAAATQRISRRPPVLAASRATGNWVATGPAAGASVGHFVLPRAPPCNPRSSGSEFGNLRAADQKGSSPAPLRRLLPAVPEAATWSWPVAAATGGRPRGGRRQPATIRRAMATDAIPDMDPTQQRLMFEDECILVDENDKVVGHDTKYNCHLMERIEKDGMLHRAFSVFLFDSQNRLMLQQRADCKVTFPLVWTNTCCSHPLYRPDELEEEGNLGVRVAARRKLEDELGIPPDQVPLEALECIGRIHYKAPSDGKWGEHELDYLLFMKGDVTVKPNPNEVAAVQYVEPDELRDLVKRAINGEEGVKLSPWFHLVVDNFLYDWWDHLKNGTLDKVKDLKTIHRLL